MSENFETPLQSPKISRRDFLKLGAAGLGAVAAAPFIATKAEASGEKPFGYVGEKEYHVSGSTINFLGVLHTPGTLIKYKDLIDE